MPKEPFRFMSIQSVKHLFLTCSLKWGNHNYKQRRTWTGLWFLMCVCNLDSLLASSWTAYNRMLTHHWIPRIMNSTFTWLMSLMEQGKEKNYKKQVTVHLRQRCLVKTCSVLERHNRIVRKYLSKPTDKWMQLHQEITVSQCWSIFFKLFICGGRMSYAV